MTCCKTCGQTLPESLPIANQFRGVQQQIVKAVHKAGKYGIRSDILFDQIYKSDPDGGPLTGVKIIAVFAWHINKILKPQGWWLHSVTVGRGGLGYYVLEKL
jgi:hypothetical protein